MTEINELDVHERAQQDFERDNPGRVWRAGAPSGSRGGKKLDYATLTERMDYLARARRALRAEHPIGPLHCEKSPMPKPSVVRQEGPGTD